MSDLKELIKKLQNSTKETVQERARAEAVFSSIGEGAIATNEQGKITKINQAALDLLGHEEADLLGQWYPKAIVAYDMKGEVLNAINRPITQAMLEGRPITAKLTYTRKDGHQIPVSATVSPIMMASRPVGAIEVFHDITKEQSIDRAKTEFVSLASHQLRTPLTAIRWNLEMLLQDEMGKLNKAQRQTIKEIYEVNLRLIELVKALLSVARIELGTFALEPQLVNLISLAKEVLFELKPQIFQKKLRLSQHYDKKIPMIPMDPDITRIIFQNLLSNAVKYTPPGGKVALGIDIDKKHVMITVADSGLGIPKNQQDKVFTKLFRADNVREQETDGTGLGLYIIKSVVDTSKGRIWFESEEGKGTTFFVRLPLSGMPRRKGSTGLEPAAGV